MHSTARAPSVEGTPVRPRPNLTIVPPPVDDTAPATTSRTVVVTWAIGVPLGLVVMTGLGVAGYLLGSSPLGAAIAVGVVVVAVVILVVLWLATHAHGVHCPGCPDC